LKAVLRIDLMILLRVVCALFSLIAFAEPASRAARTDACSALISFSSYTKLVRDLCQDSELD
jgi:hypothetical protein